MTRALRSVSSEKGRDPREFALIAYGGAGPVHAAGLAEELGCRTVLVPALAGLFSSLGLLFARPEFHDVHACHLDARAVDAGRARGGRSPSCSAARAGGRGRRGRVAAQRRAALRRPDVGGRGRASGGRARRAGAARRVRGRARAAVRRARRGRLADRDPRPAPRGARPVERGRPALARRAAARPAGQRARGVRRRRRSRCRCARARRSAPRREPGPLLVDEYDTTVVVRPGWTVRRDQATETLILERADA